MKVLNILSFSEDNAAVPAARQKACASFGGLKSAVSRDIFQKQTIDNMVQAYPNAQGIAGNVPHEVIEIFKKNSSSPQEVKEKIAKFKQSFSQAGKILREEEIRNLEQNFKNSLKGKKGIDASKLLEKLPTLCTAYQKDGQAAFKQFLNSGAQNPDDMLNKKALAAFFEVSTDFFDAEFMAAKPSTQGVTEALTKQMQELGVIPQGGRVKLEHIGLGAFGAAYEVSFLDENSNTVIHSKALKVYRDNEALASKLCDGFFNFVSKISPENIRKIEESIKENGISEKTVLCVLENLLLPVVGEEKYAEIMEKKVMPDLDKYKKFLPAIDKFFGDKIKKFLVNVSLEERWKKIVEKKPEDIKKMICGLFDMMAEYGHGVSSEANRALFISNGLGSKIDRYDLIKPYFFDLQNGISFMEMSDDKLPKPYKTYDFGANGLLFLDNHQGNRVEGRIIDYGGILKNPAVDTSV